VDHAASHEARRSRPRVELAEVVRAHAGDLGHLSSQQTRALESIASCRTASLGGHVSRCDSCDHKVLSYNSCRTRHCPKCGGLKELSWVEARLADILPIEYFHVVFTIPDKLHELFLRNQKRAYDLLFAAINETLQEVALSRLGARLGFTAVLHTWTQTLLYHPHVHCIVAGGGPDSSGENWIACKPGFFLPVRALAKVFRGKLLQKLRTAYDSGTLRGESDKVAFAIRKSSRKRWNVYCKPSVFGPENVLRYLARYTHRIAISNERLVSFRKGKVTFRVKDRKNDNKSELVALPALEFLRRFCLHVLPDGFMRVRHYGFLSNSSRSRQLPLCRQLLNAAPPPASSDKPKESWQELLFRTTGKDVTRCPKCTKGTLKVIEFLNPTSSKWTIPGKASSP